MTHGFITRLADRGVISVTGPDAAKLLQGIITNDMALLDSQDALFAGLLSPQGKVLFDFIIRPAPAGLSETEAGPCFMLDTAADQVPALVKRLTLYKLRAKAEIRDECERLNVLAMWGENAGFICLQGAFDPRLNALGQRAIGTRAFVKDDIRCSTGTEVTEDAYHAHRIALGVPEGGKDYGFGEAFAHEALFDQLHGVSFSKGCYVGQEIVARMEHRGTARRRIVPVAGSSKLPEAGTEITAGGVVIGAMGSALGAHGLAMLRLDRAAEFAAKGIALNAGDATLTFSLPQWAAFKVPPPEPQTGTS